MLKTHHKFRYVVLAVFVLLVFVLIAFIRHMENLVPVAGYFNDADLYVEDDTLSSEFDHVETDTSLYLGILTIGRHPSPCASTAVCL